MSIEEAVVLAEEDRLEDDLYPEPTAIGINVGQVVSGGTVHGGVHQTFVENKLINEAIRRHHLLRAYVDQVVQSLAPRSYRLSSQDQDLSLDRAAAARLVGDQPWVVVLGPANSGLRTAAVALLHEASQAGRRLEEILIDEERGRPFAAVDLPAERGLTYLLCLPDQRERVSPDLGRRLQAHAAHLATLDAHLVVVATPGVWGAVGSVGTVSVLQVTPPDLPEVVRRECAVHAVDASSIVGHPTISEVLARATVTDAMRLAGIIVTAVRNHPDHDVPKLVEEVCGAYGDWDDVLAAWFSAARSIRHRLFLVAAALLEGEPPAEVLDAVNSLGQTLGDLPSVRSDGLAEVGLRALMSEINAEVVDGRLRFERANYATAVLTFLHGDRSAWFHRKLWEWAMDLPLRRNDHRQTRLAERIVGNLVAIVLRSRDTRPLVWLNRWTGKPYLRPHVVQALTATAMSDEVGADVRSLLYRWSRAERASDQSLCTIAEVCSGELARLYPRVSLTRLGHIAHRGSPVVREAIVTAVRRLWEIPRLRPRIVEVVTTWTEGEAGGRAETAWRVFAALARSEAHPVLMAWQDGPLRAGLVGAVARLFDRAEADVTHAELGESLLDAALLSEENRERIVEFLGDVVRRGDGGTRRLVRLSKLAFTWQPVDGDVTNPDRREVRDHVVESLHQVDPLIVGA
ncbi:hypothetical protein [Micromonospora sagamiensis]|uniref:Uncharacterized protein n=1 Tax=Micromonospora sagamiensis TaxID=47875 RepID=A0A562WCT7_9ACTN|nr:hypothetical protein [Micromonospora sagamiensis]TWJ27841.1 hypothetical protein JD81_01341 [Micromonospora sagamiensis]BCL13270.1 hypothetical protein GCM10017556_10090 [Micromonospora sagamiensis]